MSDDRSLRRVFETLKSEDAANAPDFEVTMSQARDRASRRRRNRAGTATLVALAASVVFVTARSMDPPSSGALAAELIASEGFWRAPTDFLLERGSDPLWQSTETLRETLSYARRPE